MLHEGATKGILVTTAEFGPSALEFAAGKPLTLLGGRQLADLLARHGIVRTPCMNNLNGVLGVGDAEMRASPGRRQIRMSLGSCSGCWSAREPLLAGGLGDDGDFLGARGHGRPPAGRGVNAASSSGPGR